MNTPSYYGDAPFEAWDLSSLYTSDWGQVIQYVFRWQGKNGLQDLQKAVDFARHAIANDDRPIPWKHAPHAGKLLRQLQSIGWADATHVWKALRRRDGDATLDAIKTGSNQEKLKHQIQLADLHDHRHLRLRVSERPPAKRMVFERRRRFQGVATTGENDGTGG